MKMQFRVYLNGKQGGRYTPAGADDTDVLLAQASAQAPADVRLACKQALAGIATLPDEQRGAMLLVALEGLSYDQAAHVLDIPIGTLRSRLSRARETLRQYMDGQVTSTPPLRRVK
jgi:RNA polymerase sigma-70 factor (ECF subfamily)